MSNTFAHLRISTGAGNQRLSRDGQLHRRSLRPPHRPRPRRQRQSSEAWPHPSMLASPPPSAPSLARRPRQPGLDRRRYRRRCASAGIIHRPDPLHEIDQAAWKHRRGQGAAPTPFQCIQFSSVPSVIQTFAALCVLAGKASSTARTGPPPSASSTAPTPSPSAPSSCIDHIRW